MKPWTSVEITCGLQFVTATRPTIIRLLMWGGGEWTWHSLAVHSSCTIEESYSKTLFIHFDSNKKTKLISVMSHTYSANQGLSSYSSNVSDIQSVVV